MPSESTYNGSFKLLESPRKNNTSENAWPVRDLEGEAVYRVEDIDSVTGFYQENPDLVNSVAVPGSDGNWAAGIYSDGEGSDKTYEAEISITSGAEVVKGISEIASKHLE